MFFYSYHLRDYEFRWYRTLLWTDKAYKFEVVQGNTNQTLYITGNYKNTYYGESTTDKAAAADVYVVKAEGGYNLKLVKADGTVLYINVVASGTHRNIKFEAAASSVWNYNADLGTFTTLVEGTEYYVGTYGTYDTISPSSIDRAATSFVGHLVEVDGTVKPEPPVHEHVFVEGKCECGEKDPNYQPPVVEPTEGLKEGQAYKFQLVQPKAGKTVYFTGAMNGYYYATSEDINAGVDVYVEVVEGGYNLYFLDKAGAKHYMGIVASGTYVNAVYDKEKTVFIYDETLKTLKAVVNGEDYVFGTRNDNTYTTIGANKLSYDPFYVTFVANGETPEPPVHEHKYVDGKCECGEEDPNYQPPVVEPTEGLKEGQAYVICAENANGMLYFNGTQTSGRFNGIYEKDNATKVYVEVVEGNFKLYFFNGDTKTYIVMKDESKGGAFTTDAAAATVFEWNAEKNTLAVADDSNNRAFGTGATSTYSNFSCYDLSGAYNWGQFVAVN